ncbi:hypothetical protein [Carboxylicivirga marina]|uniref:Uncharacterized protein n=1 Tax=Carboxylicivirga marina TaxID=2800988 RepID=A0ABS1HMG6_9BACT|nr:hypothetical protein [Carboxylicivirga marina]MBK3518821.1 hypothetical protein [Carboxylicivirga marina]
MNTLASYLVLLQKQLSEVDERNFDFASWKSATLLLVTSCFGTNSAQVAAIDKIDYAYNSWALRDESGTTDPIRRECKTTLSVIISELQIKAESNTETTGSSQSNSLNFMWLPFEDELTGASLKKLKSIISQPNVPDEEIELFLKDLPNQTLVNIIRNTLTSKEFKEWISQ